MEMNYVFEGKGNKTVVFVHGLNGSIEYWRALSSILNDDYKTLLYDIRGHGDSPCGDEAFDMDMLVDDLYNLLLKLNIKKASFVGLSLGGNIVLSFAVKYPDFVDKLVLMSTFSEIDDNLKNKLLNFRHAINISYESFFDVIIKEVIPEGKYDEYMDSLKIVKKENAKKTNIEGIKNAIDLAFDFKITQQLNKINCQTLILVGSDDDILSMELTNILHTNIKNSMLVILENTKHNVIFGDNVKKVSELMRRFL